MLASTMVKLWLNAEGTVASPRYSANAARAPASLLQRSRAVPAPPSRCRWRSPGTCTQWKLWKTGNTSRNIWENDENMKEDERNMKRTIWRTRGILYDIMMVTYSDILWYPWIHHSWFSFPIYKIIKSSFLSRSSLGHPSNNIFNLVDNKCVCVRTRIRICILRISKHSGIQI